MFLWTDPLATACARFFEKMDKTAARQRTKELAEEGKKKRAQADRVKKILAGEHWRSGKNGYDDPELHENAIQYMAQAKGKISTAAANRKKRARKTLAVVNEIQKKDQSKWTQADLRNMVRLVKPDKDDNGKKIPRRLQAQDRRVEAAVGEAQGQVGDGACAAAFRSRRVRCRRFERCRTMRSRRVAWPTGWPTMDWRTTSWKTSRKTEEEDEA